MIVWYRPEESETEDLTSEGVYHLVQLIPPAVGVRAGTARGVNAGYFLKVIAARDR